MKVRVLVTCLVVSVTANVAGLLLLMPAMIERLDPVRNEMARRLEILLPPGAASSSLSARIERRIFVSHVDGQTDVFGLLRPDLNISQTNFKLVVYLHGMGSSYLEPFFIPAGVAVADGIVSSHPDTVLISPSYRREASWGNDTAMADITQNIREVCQEFPVKKIVLMGTSMGGCTVLAYAAAAPADIKAKLAGVVSVESAGDLFALYNESVHPRLKQAMTSAFGGSPSEVPELYKRKSFLSNVDGLPKGVRVAVISARQDIVVPAQLQRDIVAALEKHQVAVKLIEIDGGHQAPPLKTYLEGYDFVVPVGT